MHRKVYKTINTPVRTLSVHLLLLLLSCMFFSCENDIEKIKAITSDSNYPSLSVYDSKLIFSDSAIVKAVLNTKEYNYYETDEEKYYELPQGFIVYMYDEKGEEDYMITADYGKALMDENIWVARNNVVIRDLSSNQQLNTEELFWDRENEKIYSEKFTKITDKDGVHIGENGFEANQDFSRYQLIGAKGTVNVKEED